MTEIEKMFENAGAAKIGIKKCTTSEYLDCQNYCFISENNKCDKFSYQYPPFTAEKQIAILIALANYNLYEEDKRLMIDSFNGEIYIGFYQDITLVANATDKEFSKCVAKLINNLWQDLTDQEKEEIRRILNE